MDGDGDRLKIVARPLAFLPELVAELRGDPCEATPEAILEFLCAPGLEADVTALVDRYREIQLETDPLFIAPNDKDILDRLVWPLRQAIGAYMLGNYLGTIALCGLVAEMLAIMVFEVADPEINGSTMCDDEQKKLFGSTFERLGQHRRVEILQAYGLIDGELKASFDRIRETRRKYLHVWSSDHSKLPDDAVECFRRTLAIVVSRLTGSIRDGALVLDPKLIGYLRRNGVFGTDEPKA